MKIICTASYDSLIKESQIGPAFEASMDEQAAAEGLAMFRLRDMTDPDKRRRGRGRRPPRGSYFGGREFTEIEQDLAESKDRAQDVAWEALMLKLKTKPCISA